jgi:HEAT repeat protein
MRIHPIFAILAFPLMAGGILIQRSSMSHLIAELNDKNEDLDIRVRVARRLSELHDPRAVEPLIAALGDDAQGVRQSAAEALGTLGAQGAVEPLIAALKDKDWKFRAGAAQGLGELRDPRAVESLIDALKDSTSEVAEDAATALGKIKDPRAIQPLTYAQTHAGSPGTRTRAAKALDDIAGSPQSKPALLNAGSLAPSAQDSPPSAKAARDKKVAAHLARANKLWSSGQPEEALKECNAALSLDPRNIEASSLREKFSKALAILNGTNK